MYSVLPFENSLIGIDLTGAQVKRMLEDGIGENGSEIQTAETRGKGKEGVTQSVQQASQHD